MRDSPQSEGQRWLAQAQIDLRWCRHLHQEAAGKALALAEAVVGQVKAWLAEKEED